MNKNNFFNNKYVLVTGASSGIGYQTAKDFLELGCYVGVHYNNNKKGAEELLKISKSNKCKIFKANFSQSNQILSLWKNFRKWSQNRIDFLVNNAGYVKPMDFDVLSEKEWDKTLTINLKSTFLLSKFAIQLMKKKKWKNC